LFIPAQRLQRLPGATVKRSGPAIRRGRQRRRRTSTLLLVILPIRSWPRLHRNTTASARECRTAYRETWILSGRRISRSSCRWRTIRSASSSLSTTVHSTNTSRTSSKNIDLCSTSIFKFTKDPPAVAVQRNTSRSSSTLRRRRAETRSGSIRPMQASAFRTVHALISDSKS